MLFNSLEFICYFPIVCIGYFLLPHRIRWAWLLTASYVFYMSWNAFYALLLFAVTVITWLTALLLERAEDPHKRKYIFIVGTALACGNLFLFKYADFFLESLYTVLRPLRVADHSIMFRWILPVGISFYTLQAIGYVADVYRGGCAAQKHFGRYALFVSFFPQLVAGPIERSSSLMPQFEEALFFDAAAAASGLRLMAWGYFKKIVIADTVSTTVNHVYNNLDNFQGLPLIAATLLFAVQIFCDFSGYSDIARGCARIMGFRLSENFNHPYFSVTLKDFWNRWHISLSSWMKDYVYIPLGGNKKGEARTVLNLFLTFLLSSLWHGANWTFVIWGCWHAAWRILERFVSRLGSAAGVWRSSVESAWVGRILTFCIVCAGWVFFRANTLQDAIYVIENMFRFGVVSFRSLFTMLKLMFNTRAEVYRFILTVPLFVLASWTDWKWSLNEILLSQKTGIRMALYVCIVVYILLAARAEMQDFIYFQF